MNKYRNEHYIVQRKSKATGLWTFAVQIRNGKKLIVKSFSEKKYGNSRVAFEQAIKFRDKTIEQVRNSTLLLGETITVDEIFNKYLETTTDSFSTKKRHISIYNRFINNKDKPIYEITRADIQTDLNAMVEKATDDTISRVYTIWKNAIVGTAILYEYISKDITLGVKKPVSHVIHVKKKTDTCKEDIKEVERLILEKTQDKYVAKLIYYLIEILYYTGMRPAEAIALTKSDIHSNYISVTKELGSSLSEENVIRRCKTPTSIRDIPISLSLKPILNELLNYSQSEELFKKLDGTYINSTFVGNIIRYCIKGTGIEFNLYRLRHNMATELISNKVDSRTTMDILGHSHFGTSLYYANSSKEQKEDAIKLLS